MPPLRLVQQTQPRSATASFKKIAEILQTGTWIFPDDGKYNGSIKIDDLSKVYANKKKITTSMG
jgi:hypothetical protein